MIEPLDDKWREVAARLVADTSRLDGGLERGFFGELGPSLGVGALVLEAGRLAITRFVKLTERLDTLYGAELDPATRERLRAAQQQLQATVEVLTGLPDALDPNYRRR